MVCKMIRIDYVITDVSVINCLTSAAQHCAGHLGWSPIFSWLVDIERGGGGWSGSDWFMLGGEWGWSGITLVYMRGHPLQTFTIFIYS